MSLLRVRHLAEIPPLLHARIRQVFHKMQDARRGVAVRYNCTPGGVAANTLIRRTTTFATVPSMSESCSSEAVA